MKKKILTFSEFKLLVTEIYGAFSQHCTWDDLRVWDSVPGDMLKERDCWYAIMRVNETCHMMIQYSPDDDDPNPYTCWYDYMYPQTGTVNYPHWNFDNLEEAMHFCMREPMRDYQSEMFSYCILRPVVSPANNLPFEQTITSVSFVGAFDYLQEHMDDDKFPEGDWTVYWWKQPLGRTAVSPMYKIHAGKFPDCNWYFVTIPRWGMPDFIYKPLTPEDRIE